jgi:general secretion pathway protein C
MLQRVFTAVVWGLVGLTAVGFGLRLWPGGAPSAAPLVGLNAAPAGMDPAAADRLFGALAPVAAAVPTDTRFKLLGVAAPRAVAAQAHEGVALLSIDDGPPRAVRVGQWVDGETQLLAVTARTADLGRDGVVRAQLRLEAPPAATTGSMAPVTGISVPPPPPMPAPMPAPTAGQLPLRGGNPSEVPMPIPAAQGAGDEAGPQRPMPTREQQAR